MQQKLTHPPNSPLTGLVAELLLFEQDMWYLGDGGHTGVTHGTVRSRDDAQTELNMFIAFGIGGNEGH